VGLVLLEHSRMSAVRDEACMEAAPPQFPQEDSWTAVHWAFFTAEIILAVVVVCR